METYNGNLFSDPAKFYFEGVTKYGELPVKFTIGLTIDGRYRLTMETRYKVRDTGLFWWDTELVGERKTQRGIESLLNRTAHAYGIEIRDVRWTGL